MYVSIWITPSPADTSTPRKEAISCQRCKYMFGLLQSLIRKVSPQIKLMKYYTWYSKENYYIKPSFIEMYTLQTNAVTWNQLFFVTINTILPWYVCTGLDDKGLLPNYPYRDDALDIWYATKTYVANVVKHFYKSDAVSWTAFTISFQNFILLHLETNGNFRSLSFDDLL